MAKKKVTKASKRRLLFFGTISIGIVAYCTFSVFYYTMNIYKLKLQEKNLQKNLIVLKEDEKNLKIEMEKLKNPDYLARYAREKYLYSKDGEIVIKVNNNEIKNTQSEKKPNYTNIIFFGSLILLIIVGYVIKKSKKK